MKPDITGIIRRFFSTQGRHFPQHARRAPTERDFHF
jgi:hypothetical protein